MHQVDVLVILGWLHRVSLMLRLSPENAIATLQSRNAIAVERMSRSQRTYPHARNLLTYMIPQRHTPSRNEIEYAMSNDGPNYPPPRTPPPSGRQLERFSNKKPMLRTSDNAGHISTVTATSAMTGGIPGTTQSGASPSGTRPTPPLHLSKGLMLKPWSCCQDVALSIPDCRSRS